MESILKEQRIRKYKDKECWFCRSLEDTLRLMELTVMQEGKLYINADGRPAYYPHFEPEEYVILEITPRYQNGEWVSWNQELSGDADAGLIALAEEFSGLKIGFRGDLKFYKEPVVHPVAELLQEQTQMEGELPGFTM